MFNKLIAFDKSWLYSWNNFANSTKASRIVFKISAEYLIYIFPIIFLILWFWQASARKVALKAALAGVIAWGIFAKIIGTFINRPRPFEANGVKELFFHRPDYSFPSDHAAFLFAVSFSFWLSGYKKLATFSFILAIIISVSRIAAAIHYPSDILAGVVIGLVVAWLVWLFDRPLNYLYNFLIGVARRIKLA